MGQPELWRFIRTLRVNPRRRMYVLTLVGLTTMAWTVLFTGGLLLGVLPPQHVPGLCQFVVDSATCNNHPHKFLPFSTGRPTQAPRVSPPVVHTHSGVNQQRRTGFGGRRDQENIMQLKKPPSMPLMDNDTFRLDYKVKPKNILRWTRFYGKGWGVPQGSHIFKELNCPYQACVVTDEKSQVKEADAVLVHMRDIQEPSQLPRYRNPQQRWIMHTLESPYHSEVNLTKFNGLFNWTSTYSDESDIPCPYGEYMPYELDKNPLRAGETINKDPPSMAALRQKSRIAAWFVTNCKAQNKREWFIEELQKHIQVDVYGICGKLKCKDPAVCQEMLKQRYKFYIAFENSSCKQYITEKFWANALQNDIVPVVMGAPAVDYEKYAPPHSFIHIDNFSSPRELARHLKILHKNVNLYNEYFRWKTGGSARSYVNFKPSNSRFWCDLCAALHNNKLPRKTHWDLASWWSVEKQCKS